MQLYILRILSPEEFLDSSSKERAVLQVCIICQNALCCHLYLKDPLPTKACVQPDSEPVQGVAQRAMAVGESRAVRDTEPHAGTVAGAEAPSASPREHPNHLWGSKTCQIHREKYVVRCLHSRQSRGKDGDIGAGGALGLMPAELVPLLTSGEPSPRGTEVPRRDPQH